MRARVLPTRVTSRITFTRCIYPHRTRSLAYMAYIQFTVLSGDTWCDQMEHEWVRSDIVREAICNIWVQMDSHRARRAARGGKRHYTRDYRPGPQSRMGRYTRARPGLMYTGIIGPGPSGVSSGARGGGAAACAAASPSTARAGAGAARDRVSRGAPAPSAACVLGGVQVEQQEQDEKECLRTRVGISVKR